MTDLGLPGHSAPRIRPEYAPFATSGKLAFRVKFWQPHQRAYSPFKGKIPFASAQRTDSEVRQGSGPKGKSRRFIENRLFSGTNQGGAKDRCGKGMKDLILPRMGKQVFTNGKIQKRAEKRKITPFSRRRTISQGAADKGSTMGVYLSVLPAYQGPDTLREGF